MALLAIHLRQVPCMQQLHRTYANGLTNHMRSNPSTTSCSLVVLCEWPCVTSASCKGIRTLHRHSTKTPLKGPLDFKSLILCSCLGPGMHHMGNGSLPQVNANLWKAGRRSLAAACPLDPNLGSSSGGGSCGCSSFPCSSLRAASCSPALNTNVVHGVVKDALSDVQTVRCQHSCGGGGVGKGGSPEDLQCSHYA